ncbi:hypothetical protein [Rhodococcus koreensis]
MIMLGGATVSVTDRWLAAGPQLPALSDPAVQAVERLVFLLHYGIDWLEEKWVAFGGGLHHCLGAPIARIQLQETLKGLIENIDSIELRDPGERFPDLVFPALVSLPMTLRLADAR